MVANGAAVRERRSEWLSGLIVLLVGAPLVFVFVRAMVDGERHRREAPVRAMIGEESFDALMSGQKTPVHYLGAQLAAPDFSLPDREGKTWRLADHRGKVVVMNFWSVTCQPCVEEMPSLIELARMGKGRSDIEVVAISTDAGWSDVAPIMPPNNPLRVLFDPQRKVVTEKFGSTMYPETWIIDRDGIVRARIDGGRDWSAALALDFIEAYL
jgi:peroxiredoxin